MALGGCGSAATGSGDVGECRRAIALADKMLDAAAETLRTAGDGVGPDVTAQGLDSATSAVQAQNEKIRALSTDYQEAKDGCNADR